MKGLLFFLGFFFLLGTEIARVYFIMPFPGSQQSETIDLAYFIQSNLGLIRLIGLALLASPLYHYFRKGSRLQKFGISLALLFYLAVFYLFNFKFLADKMFYQPRSKVFATVAQNKVPTEQLVIGVTIRGEAKAFPIEIIGYHHQVRDSIGGEPVMVTYCTVCRTGRAFSPMVDNHVENFRLVGMDHFNAMFEDRSTRSWWRQVNGVAIAGKLKGQSLAEIPSQQMSLKAWIGEHPNTSILQPDSAFLNEYEGLKDYDEGKTKGSLERTDSMSWHNKSWVVGVQLGLYARAYDWFDLRRLRIINDSFAHTPLVVALENDTVSFHVWSRLVDRDTLDFIYSDSLKFMVDTKTHSTWDWAGYCQDG
jgi:Protein of unknown function (DUF3179)